MQVIIFRNGAQLRLTARVLRLSPVRNREPCEEAWIPAPLGAYVQELRVNNALESGQFCENIPSSKPTNHGSRVKFSHEKLKDTNEI